ncbi:hypothetical protein ZOSMA_76G00270 [Zostera marina]|uniref:CRM domain-containing protein n=1 Tax=Zostera marina TaxID=29655 RepID=A0A0K9NNY3_ZOSMR|nr:hypothetical protein ZOSMA_76G00270 [Zostera marina]
MDVSGVGYRRLPLLALFSSSTPTRPSFLHFTSSTSPSSKSPLLFFRTPHNFIAACDSEYSPTSSSLSKQGGESHIEQKSAFAPVSTIPCPTLTIKEKKELASYAHSLGKKLKIQQVGKSGVTPSVAASFVENLESNELLKIKVQGSCPEEFADTVQILERSTCSVAISQIGRSVILYRPSVTKMNKRETQNRTRKIWTPKPKEPAAYHGGVLWRGQQSIHRQSPSEDYRRRSRV